MCVHCYFEYTRMNSSPFIDCNVHINHRLTCMSLDTFTHVHRANISSLCCLQTCRWLKVTPAPLPACLNMNLSEWHSQKVRKPEGQGSLLGLLWLLVNFSPPVMFMQATPNLHPPTEVRQPVGAVPVETVKVMVSQKITLPQTMHDVNRSTFGEPGQAFSGCPHVCSYHSDSDIYKTLPCFSVQNQHCSSKQDNIHFRWVRCTPFTCIQRLWAISHYRSLSRVEKEMETKASACFVSLCLPRSKSSWTAQIK